MKGIATYCSALKSEEKGLLPATKRYTSERIGRAHQHARDEGVPFFILSGLFGLIPGSLPIPYYDHLLVESELKEHIEKVTAQLMHLQLSELHFISRDPAVDPNLHVYLWCIRQACENARISLALTLLKEP